MTEPTLICPGPSGGSGSSPDRAAWSTPPDRDPVASLRLAPVFDEKSCHRFTLKAKLMRVRHYYVLLMNAM